MITFIAKIFVICIIDALFLVDVSKQKIKCGLHVITNTACVRVPTPLRIILLGIFPRLMRVTSPDLGLHQGESHLQISVIF
jgi:hypothetical protein